jgi:BMFP domain-containing protein YqiC
LRVAIIRTLPYMDDMQTQNPFLDEFAKLSTAFMGLAQSAGEEARTAFRAQADRMAAELDLVRREDFEALKAQVAALTAELAVLRAGSMAGASEPSAEVEVKPAPRPRPKKGE